MTVWTPTTLSAALALRADMPQLTPMAGGTALLPDHPQLGSEQQPVLHLGGLEELKTIAIGDEYIHIGAAATVAELLAHGELAHLLPALCEAAQAIGIPAVRNAATIGGNIASSHPVMDLSPVLLAYDAQVVLQHRGGERRCALTEFFLDWKTPDIRADELITAFRIPRPSPTARARYLRLGTRKALSCSKVGLAGYLEFDGPIVKRCRLAAASMASIPLRLDAVEQILAGQVLNSRTIDSAVRSTARMIYPISDLRSTAEYRAYVLERLVRRFLEQDKSAAM